MTKGIAHQIWKNKEGLTGVCFENSKGDDFRNLLEDDYKLIHTFYASSHYGAMKYYYKFMDLGEYETMHKEDYEVYDEIKNAI